MPNSIYIKEIAVEKVWPLRHKVMWPGKSIEFVKLSRDFEGNHFGLIINDKVISVVSLFIDSDTAQFRKLATLEEEQGRGYASILLEHVFLFAKNKGIQHVWCNARKDKIAFYKKFDMIPTQDEFQKEGIDFVILKKAL